MATWTRTSAQFDAIFASFFTLATVDTGHTLLRSHIGVDCLVRATFDETPDGMAQTWLGIGVYSTLHSAPQHLSPHDTPSDVEPPLQRWLWWGVIGFEPAPSPAPQPGAYQTWRLAGGPLHLDIEAMVLANGQALDIVLAVAPANGPGTTVLLPGYYWASVLTS